MFFILKSKSNKKWVTKILTWVTLKVTRASYGPRPAGSHPWERVMHLGLTEHLNGACRQTRLSE